jgi:methylthioribose-1-phosphate isomerase
MSLPLAVEWRREGRQGVLAVLDQTRLPGETAFLYLTSVGTVVEAIRSLRVRGAPAIGLAAAWGAVLAVQTAPGQTRADLDTAFSEGVALLAASRPTAVNLRWALDRMTEAFAALEPGLGRALVIEALERRAAVLQADDAATGLRLAENGLSLLQPGWGILTHCNAGAIATAGWGTALAPLHLGQQRGFGFRVWADETRPLLQGSRLTAWELQASGVDVTVLCDNAAASVLATGAVQAVLVGCDRVAANGDVANKVGTLGLAVLARHFGVPFYVFAPVSTLDPATPDGAAIPIEQRGRDEVARFGGVPVVPEGVAVANPAFDVTPASLVTAIVTDRGVLRAPYGPAIAGVTGEAVHG